MKKLLFITIIFLAGCTLQSNNLGADLQVVKLTKPIISTDFQIINWVEPTTDVEWAEDIKNEQFNRKYDYQLKKMLSSQITILKITLEDLYKVEKYPDAYALDLYEQDFTQEEIEIEILSTQDYWRWKAEKISQSIKRLEKEIELRANNKVDRTNEILGTIYYIDFNCNPGVSGADGTTAVCDGGSDDSFNSLEDFTEVARVAGDRAIVRRGTASTTNLRDVGFTSRGDIGNPIILEADYDDAWGDFGSSAQTYTPIFGSKTMEASASITGIAVNDWIFVINDIPRNHAYEVASVSGTTLTLYLPYKGNQSGSGNTLTVMPDAPIWGTVTNTSGSLVRSSDFWWIIQGLDLRSADSSGVFDTVRDNVLIKDIICQSNGTADACIDNSSSDTQIIVEKSRFFNIELNNGSNSPTRFELSDIFFDGNNDSSNSVIANVDASHIIFKDLNVVNMFSSGKIITMGGVSVINSIRGLVTDGTGDYNDVTSDSSGVFNIEDFEGKVGRNQTFTGILGANNENLILSESTTTASLLRPGGGDTAGIFYPTIAHSSFWEFSRIKLFEYPIYADTSSKQYDVYFKSTSTDHWTNDPTAGELYLEAEYWGHATNNFRRTATSSGVIDFNGSTDWQALSITIQPLQEGIIYLSGWYGKPKEVNPDDTNVFFMDTAPVIQ